MILLAAPPVAPAAPQAPEAPPPPVPLSVAATPVRCMVAGTNPQLDAGITPGEQVQVGRVYFKSVLGDAFFYVEMTIQGERYVGVLPKPRLDAGPITYYVEGVGRDRVRTLPKGRSHRQQLFLRLSAAPLLPRRGQAFAWE